ncbi:ompF [Wigglesworthia glossinidia endosymbiont of Glossina brevipalpis]|uniref:OmpF protein n=1 Tax=Wigglesworthia glossinidia brevipalpis TaxID=36870 RepID=Q8D2T5_WIGBR|nr:ompF [Wigglesworthia glossinidia endosymbiont of Glossina brevipalpis]
MKFIKYILILSILFITEKNSYSITINNDNDKLINFHGKIFSKYTHPDISSIKKNVYLTYGIDAKWKLYGDTFLFWKIDYDFIKNKYQKKFKKDNNISLNILGINLDQYQTIKYGKDDIIINSISDLRNGIDTFNKSFNFDNIIIGSKPKKVITYYNKDLYNLIPGIKLAFQKILKWNSTILGDEIIDNFNNIKNYSNGAMISYYIKDNYLYFIASFLRNNSIYNLNMHEKKYNTNFLGMGLKYERFPFYFSLIHGKKWNNFNLNENDKYLEKNIFDNSTIELLTCYNFDKNIRPFLGYSVYKSKKIYDLKLIKDKEEKNIFAGTLIKINNNIETNFSYLIKLKNNKINNIDKYNNFSLIMTYKF